jgi:hypothetical protein
MKRSRLWAAVSGIMLIVCAYAFLNFMAAADLGYDGSSRGGSILRLWGYVALGCLAGTFVTAAMALYGHRKNRKRADKVGN